MRRVLLASLIILMLAFVAGAQTSSGSIAGTVVDPQQAAVANANVNLIEAEKKISLNAKTDAEGRFVFPQVLPGKYTLTVENPGFKKAERKDLTLLANDKISAGTIVLEVGTVSESVEVSAEALTLKTESAER